MKRRMTFRVVWSEKLNAYTIKARRFLFYKTVCAPVDEFDVKPLTFDNASDALIYARKINHFNKYIFR